MRGGRGGRSGDGPREGACAGRGRAGGGEGTRERANFLPETPSRPPAAAPAGGAAPAGRGRAARRRWSGACGGLGASNMAPAPGEANPGRGYSGGSGGGRAGMRGRPRAAARGGGAGIFPGKGKLGSPAPFRQALTQPPWAPRPCLPRSAPGSGNAAFALGNRGGAFDTGSSAKALLPSLLLPRQSPWAGSSVRVTQPWHRQVFHCNPRACRASEGNSRLLKAEVDARQDECSLRCAVSNHSGIHFLNMLTGHVHSSKVNCKPSLLHIFFSSVLR